MALTHIVRSDWRSAQFRQALRARGLPSTDADVDRVAALDSAIRSALMARIAVIEVALRGRVDRACTTRFGRSWHVGPRAFRTGTPLDMLHARFSEALERSDDPAARRLWASRRLDGVPSGLLCEHLSLGTLSRVVGTLDPIVVRGVAGAFRVPAPTMRATLQHVTHVRNRCAHHARIWGSRFGVPMPKYRSPTDLVGRLESGEPRSPWRSLVLIDHLAASVPLEPDRDDLASWSARYGDLAVALRDV